MGYFSTVAITLDKQVQQDFETEVVANLFSQSLTAKSILPEPAEENDEAQYQAYSISDHTEFRIDESRLPVQLSYRKLFSRQSNRSNKNTWHTIES